MASGTAGNMATGTSSALVMAETVTAAANWQMARLDIGKGGKWVDLTKNLHERESEDDDLLVVFRTNQLAGQPADSACNRPAPHKHTRHAKHTDAYPGQPGGRMRSRHPLALGGRRLERGPARRARHGANSRRGARYGAEGTAAAGIREGVGSGASGQQKNGSGLPQSLHRE